MTANGVTGGDPNKVSTTGGIVTGTLDLAAASNPLQIPHGAQAGYVWTDTDGSGNGAWQPGGGGGAGTVVSVNNITPNASGNITLTAADVGADAAGAAAAAQAAAITAAEANAAATYVPLSAEGAASGVATLDASGHLTTAQAANLLKTSQLGAASGAASLNAGGRVPAAQLGQSPVNLTDGATIATDASLSNFFRVTLGGNRTLSNPTNGVDGQLVTWSVKQDGTGSRTLTTDTKFRFGTDITSITLTTTAGKTDHIGARYNSGDDKWDVIAFVRGF